MPKLMPASAIAPIDKSDARFVSSIYLLAKKTPGEYRHIVELRPINAFCDVPPCKFKSLSLLLDLARADDVSFAADLKDDY